MMHRIAVVLSVVAFAGCSSSSPSGPGTPSGPVSFRSDVAPVFATSCATNSDCHGSADGSNVYLAGPATDSKRTLAGLVNKPANELPTMPYITPGDPTNSYLMHKIDGDLSSLGACKTKGVCGDPMPKNQPTLDTTTRELIRQWITEGAKDG
jgi:hypothetical protein